MNHTSNDFQFRFSVDRTVDEVFDAINDVRAWWSGEIEGPTDRLDAAFTYRYRALHRSTQKVIELARGERIVWQVTEADLGFVEQQHEWEGTTIVFELTRHGDRTEITFTHRGLRPSHQCWDRCSRGWSTLLGTNLRARILSGRPQPDAFA